MKPVSERDQQKLLEFAKFFRTYNPEYRMAAGMASRFHTLRNEVDAILKKHETPDF